MPPVIVQEDAGAHGSLWSASLSGLDTPAGPSNQPRRAAQISARLLAKCLNSKVFAPKFTRFNSSGQLALEDKDHMKKRLSFSPDLADAGALSFTVNLTRVQEVDWDELRRRPAGGWLSG